MNKYEKYIQLVLYFINKYIKYIKYFIVSLSLLSIIVFLNPVPNYKDFGSFSWSLLMVVMFVRPLKDIFKKCKLFSIIGKFRRELAILVGVFGITHGVGYMMIMNYGSVADFIGDSYLWDYKSFLFWGLVSVLISIPLLITSNSLFTKLMGKHWKTLQKLSYFMFFFVTLHIFLIKKEIGPVIFFILWLILYIIAYFKNKSKTSCISIGPKWYCVPCGYIYDENIGDADGGIKPGTKFEDIPDDWRCPVCGVGKSDFILLEGEIKTNPSKIVSLNYLTKDVIELKIDLGTDLDFKSGQFLNFVLTDNLGDFNRCYSVVKKELNIFTFLIKLKIDGRAGKLFKTKKVGDNLKYVGISGSFLLKENSNPKVFIATGTGLAPVFSMLSYLPKTTFKQIYFGAQTKQDLFYLKELNNISDLKINIYLSKEKIEGFNFGRINLKDEIFESETEFYICGSPSLVKDTKDILEQKGFKNIFCEEF